MVLVKNLKFFYVFIFGKINHQNVFDVTLESQKAFLHYKKPKLKKVEKSGFFQRGYGQKFEIFPCFYFWQDQPPKCV